MTLFSRGQARVEYPDPGALEPGNQGSVAWCGQPCPAVPGHGRRVAPEASKLATWLCGGAEGMDQPAGMRLITFSSLASASYPLRLARWQLPAYGF